MGLSMCNLCYIQVSTKNLKKIKDIIEKIKIDEDLKYGFNVCPFFEVEQIKEDELKLTCGGKCSGHEKEILENIGDINIKMIAQKIDMDNEMFYIYYYLKNNDIKKFIECEFEFNDEMICCNNVLKLQPEEITYLLEEGIILKKNDGYKFTESKRFMHRTIGNISTSC